MTKEQLKSILGELEADLKKSAAELEAAELEKLKKADEEAPADSAGSGDTSAPTDSAPSDSPAPAPDAPAADPAADQGTPEAPVTVESLTAEYNQLDDASLQMHEQALAAAKQARAQAPAPAAPPAASPSPTPEMAMKSEKLISDLLTKFESKISEALTKSESSAKEDIENLAKAVKMIAEAPLRKGITSISDVAPSKEAAPKTYTSKDVHNLVKENASKLTKAERDLWLKFIDKRVTADKLAPMLERLTSGK